MNKDKEQRMQYVKFFKELDLAIRIAGGVGVSVFSDDELEKMMVIFAHNDISIVCKYKLEVVL